MMLNSCMVLKASFMCTCMYYYIYTVSRAVCNGVQEQTMRSLDTCPLLFMFS